LHKRVVRIELRDYYLFTSSPLHLFTGPSMSLVKGISFGKFLAD
jgi:hypothetical protein